jgi:hypothetical protein
MWLKDKQSDLLAKLDGVYNILEAQFLTVQEGRYEESLKAQQMELVTLKRTAENTTAKLEYLTAEAAEKKLQVMAHTVSIYAIFLFLFVTLTGCGFISWEYSRNMREHRMFALVTRFLELTGWLRLMSVLAATSGLASILIAQLFQIVQKTHENSCVAPSLREGAENPLEPDSPVIVSGNEKEAPEQKMKSFFDGLKRAMRKNKLEPVSKTKTIEETETQDSVPVSKKEVEEDERLTLSEEDLESNDRITLTVTEEDLESVADLAEAKEDESADSEPIAARSDWDESSANDAETEKTQRERA